MGPDYSKMYNNEVRQRALDRQFYQQQRNQDREMMEKFNKAIEAQLEQLKNGCVTAAPSHALPLCQVACCHWAKEVFLGRLRELWPFSFDY